MAFALHGYAMVGGVPTDGLQCVAFAAPRFALPPALGDPVPDADPPDAGPQRSGPVYGGTGAFTLAVEMMENYYIGCYEDFNPSLIAWEGPMPARQLPYQIGPR